jgi:hypothetical protein
MDKFVSKKEDPTLHAHNIVNTVEIDDMFHVCASNSILFCPRCTLT